MHRSPWLVWSALLLACARAEALPDPPRDPGTSAAPSGRPDRTGSPSGAPTPACSAGDWCWVHGRTVYDLAAGGGEVFAVGALGAVLSWTGEGFVEHPSPTRDALRSVWLSGPDDVWVTNGASEVFHYDGSDWTQFAASGSKLSGSAPNDVWLDTQHFDGTGFRERRPPGLGWFADLLARGPDDVWVLGLPGAPGESIDTDSAIVMHFDGSQWRQRGGALDGPVWNGKLVNVDGEVWIDSGSSVFRLEGDIWREQAGKFGFAAWQPPQPDAEFIALFDGESIARVPLSTRCTGAARVSAAESFCFSEEGRLFRFDGASWSPAPQDPFGATLPAQQWGRVSPELWAGEAKLAWGTGPTNVFRVRTIEASEPGATLDVLERYDGRFWSELARGYFTAITGSAADDVWIAGATLLRWDGTAVREVERPAAWADDVLTGAVSFGPRAAYFVARDRGVLRYDGAWSVVLTPSQKYTTFQDIGGDREDELWVIATQQPMLRERGTGLLLRFDGAAWQTAPLWPTWGLGDLALDRDSVWISDGEGVYRLSRATVMDSPPPAAAENTFSELPRESGLWPFEARLWRGPSDLWLTTSKQAMRLPL